MNAKKLYKRVCATLEADVRRSWGRVQEVEERTCGRGKMSRFYNGTQEILLRPVLEFLCGLGIQPASFFARCLGTPLDAEVLLADLIVDPRNGDRFWRRVKSATAQLEQAGDLEANGRGFVTLEEAAEMLAAMASASSREQMRRLRKTARYRDRAFAGAYLKHLDGVRDEDPELVYRLAATVAIHLIPAISGPLRARAELQCEALGIFGSAARLKDNYPIAAEALYLALQLAQRHDLSDAKGRLLIRSAHLLENNGNPEFALIALREAIEIYVHSGSEVDLGKTLIVQGRMFGVIKAYDKAIEVLTAGLSKLNEDQPELTRYRFSAHQALAEALHKLGDPKAARAQLAQAATFVSPEQRVRHARLAWQEGGFRLAEGDAVQAEALFDTSQQGLKQHMGAIQEALVTVDLVRSLLKQGQLMKASDTASRAARFLELLGGNLMAKAAVLELVRAGIEGGLSLTVIYDIRGDLEKARLEVQAR